MLYSVLFSEISPIWEISRFSGAGDSSAVYYLYITCVCWQVKLKLEDRGSNELFAACPVEQVRAVSSSLLSIVLGSGQ